MRCSIIRAVLFFFFIPAIGFSATIIVPDDYPTIQQAVDAANSGDTVLVKPGEYWRVKVIGKDVSIRSTNGAGVTVIDGNFCPGGVVFLGDASTLEGFTVTGGVFDGGVRLYGPSTVRSCIIKGNQSEKWGGGVYIQGSPLLYNNIIHNNWAHEPPFTDSAGGGIFIAGGSPVIMNNTICYNVSDTGGGIARMGSGSPFIKNNILWGNMAYITKPQIYGAAATFCDVEGGWPGTGNIDADPLFIDPINGDFHLTFNSPCRGSGDNSAVLELYDFESDPRIAYGTVDMGADEFYTHLYWTGNATPGGNVEVKFVGLPGTSPVGLCIGTGVLDPPIPSMWGDWYLQFPIIGPMDLGSITSPEGVLIVPGTIPASPPPPYSIPMQALIGAELTNLSLLEVK